MKTVKKDAIDLMVEAAKNKKLMDTFKRAESPRELRDICLRTEPSYSISEEDCKKLLDGRVAILEALKTYNEKGFY